jgi:hypothetical protein
MKPGFHPLKNAKEKLVEYNKYYLVPGVWVYEEVNQKPKPCWATFTPKKQLLGCSFKFLDAKERVKIDKINKILQKY